MGKPIFTPVCSTCTGRRQAGLDLAVFAFQLAMIMNTVWRYCLLELLHTAKLSRLDLCTPLNYLPL